MATGANVQPHTSRYSRAISTSRLGSMAVHASAPIAAMAAAVAKDAFQPKWAAITGVNAAVHAPPTCPPIFMIPETTPTYSPLMSAVTAQ